MFLIHRVFILEDMSLQVPTVLKKRESDDKIREWDNKKSAAAHIWDHKHERALNKVYPDEHNHIQDPE